MGEEIKVVNSGGLGLTSILTIIFVVLKLVGTITWSWWWVFSPLWISFGIGISILLIVLFIMLIAMIIVDR